MAGIVMEIELEHNAANKNNGQNLNALQSSALSWYESAEIARLCLSFQDEYGGNVNVLLWSHWLDINGFTLDLAFWEATSRRANLGDAIWVAPFRRMRRLVPKYADGSSPLFRKSLQRLELSIELQLLKWLERRTRQKLSFEESVSEGDYLRYCLLQKKVTDTDAFIRHWNRAIKKGENR